MKKKTMLAMLIVGILLSGNTGFAGSNPNVQNIPLGSERELLFVLENSAITFPQTIQDLEYDLVNEELTIIVRSDSMEHWNALNQYVYTLNGDEVGNPQYPLLEGYDRKGIEIGKTGAYSLEQVPEGDDFYLNDFAEGLKSEVVMQGIKGFVVQGDQILYELSCQSEKTGFLVGSTAMGTELAFVDFENLTVETDLMIRGYDFSPDGSKVFYLGTRKNDEQKDRVLETVIGCYDIKQKTTIEMPIAAESTERYGFDLYATNEHLVILSKELESGKAYIERYTYDGTLIDGFETNFCIRKITEGPDGSTIYIQRRYLDFEFNKEEQEEQEEQEKQEEVFGPLEVVQINWDGEESTTSTGTMHHVVQERTRTGLTIARFSDRQFGLLRMEESETGIVDYKAPIRSKENLVKLQIPYCDIKAKLESGARNLIVEYMGQSIEISMEKFGCADLLAGMPCQDDASIEIILHADEAGKVTYSIQLFVVEQVDAMTKVVHRKTIQ